MDRIFVFSLALFVVQTVLGHICEEAAQDLTVEPVCFKGKHDKTFENKKTLECFKETAKSSLDGYEEVAGACDDQPEMDPCRMRMRYTFRACASDGGTYKNRWHIGCYANKHGLDIKYEKPGRCDYVCPHSLEYKPVCCKDGDPFFNMEQQECFAKRRPYHEEKLVEDGGCLGESSDPCNDVDNDWHLHCATDGRTYIGSHSIRCKRLKGEDIDILHENECTLEEVERLLTADEICSIAKEIQTLLWCDSEERNFTSIYDFSCKKQGDSALKPEDLRPCREIDMWSYKPCEDKTYTMSVCGEDGKFYETLHEYTCAMSEFTLFREYLNWKEVKSAEECDLTDPCEIIGEADPDYWGSAFHYRKPICGTDNKTYPGTAGFFCAKKDNPDLKVKHSDPCVQYYEEKYGKEK